MTHRCSSRAEVELKKYLTVRPCTAGNKAWRDTKNSDHFASAPGATTGYNSFKTPGDWVP